MARLAKTTDKDFHKYIERKLVAWFRRFPAKNDPDRKKKDEADDRNGAEEDLDDTVYEGGEDQGLDPSDEDRTDSEAGSGSLLRVCRVHFFQKGVLKMVGTGPDSIRPTKISTP